MFAKIKNKKVTGLVDTPRTEGEYLPATITNIYPEGESYPEIFYSKKSEKPITAIRDGFVDVYYHYILDSVDSIKDKLFNLQQKSRQAMQLGTFNVGGMDIFLKDREDSLIIASLSEQETNFKVGRGVWVTLSSEDVVTLKAAHNNHVQSAYDWEKQQNEIVASLTTVDELNTYYLDNEEEL